MRCRTLSIAPLTEAESTVNVSYVEDLAPMPADPNCGARQGRPRQARESDMEPLVGWTKNVIMVWWWWFGV